MYINKYSLILVMEIEREIFERLKEELKRKQITAIIGSRQVGKTTLLKELYSSVKKDAIYLSFDDLDYLRQFEEDIKLFSEQYVKPNKYIFIDEFQYAKDGGQKLKFIYDFFEGKKKIFISGSSTPALSIESLQFLVGRVNIIEIFPLSFKEFIKYRAKEKLVLFDKIRTQANFLQLKPEFEEYLRFGGYPQVVLEKTEELKIDTLSNIVKTYLLKEIKDILGYRNIYDFENLLRRLSLQDGKLLNKSSFSLDLGINRNSIDEMISILNKTYILNILMPYLKNKIKEQIKSPKTYFTDLGVKNSLSKNFNTLEFKIDKGEIYENFILNQLIRMKKDLKFWNLDQISEMDFVYEESGKIIAIEVKSKLKDDKLTTSIKKFIEYNSPKIVYVFNENIDSEIKYENTKIVFTNYLNCFSLLKYS